LDSFDSLDWLKIYTWDDPVNTIQMSVLSVRIDLVLEEKISFLMKNKKISDKSAYIRQLLDRSIAADIIDFLAAEVRMRHMSAWKAAEIACISLRHMLEELATRDVPTYSEEAFLEDINHVEGK
jgi:predicted HTH domain antitoxin